MIKARLNKLERRPMPMACFFIGQMTAQEVYENLKNDTEFFAPLLMRWAESIPERRYKAFYEEFLIEYRKDTASHHKELPHTPFVRALGFRYHAPQMPMRPLKLICNLDEQLQKLNTK
jgi:hypothetical protein